MSVFFRKSLLGYNVEDVKKYCSEQVDKIWEEVKRFENPHKYYVDLSQKLWDIKQHMLMGKTIR